MKGKNKGSRRVRVTLTLVRVDPRGHSGREAVTSDNKVTKAGC